MHKLTFDPEPRIYGPYDLRGIDPRILKMPVTFPPTSGKTFQRFLQENVNTAHESPEQMDALLNRRRQLSARLKDRGYEYEETPLPRDRGLRTKMVGGMPFELANGGRAGKCQGVIHYSEFGNIEGPHIEMFIDMLRRQTADQSGWVLDIGCGPDVMAPIKRNVEWLLRNGNKKIIYADRAPNFVAGLERAMQRSGFDPDFQRRFITADKNNLPASIDPGTVSAVIRAGVYRMSEAEAAGLRTIGTDDLEVFIANGIEGNPLEQLLDVAEPHFPEIEVQIGLERYAVLLKARAAL